MNGRKLGMHIMFWVVVMMTYAVSEWGYRNNFQEAIIFEFLFLPVRLIAVYVNWFFLLPRFLYKYKIVPYLGFLILLLFVLALAQRYLTLYWGYPTFFPGWMVNQNPDPLVFFRVVQNVVIIVGPVAFSTGIKLFLDWYKQKNLASQLAFEKRETELKYLKSQINPHFLFNTLNNLYGLSIEKSAKLPSLILRLSDFLSYSLYESESEKIRVEKEIKLIRDFVELETDRYGNRVEVSWDIDESVFDWPIASLLFMPLVENAFKHGVREEIEHGEVHLFLGKGKAVNWLVFKVENSLPHAFSEESTPGIGLNNLKRRLQLLYPDRYILKTEKTENQFVAELRLQVYA